MPHLGFVPLASSDREAPGYVFCELCAGLERNTDLAQNYCLHHRPGHGQTQDAPSSRTDQVEDAIRTTLLAEVRKIDIQLPLISAADSSRPQLSSSSTEEDVENTQPIESCPPSPLAYKQPRQSESSQRPPLSQPTPSIPRKTQSGRRGPGRRAENLRIDLPNPPPLPPPGERPDPELIAKYGVIIPRLPLVPGVRPSKQPSRIAEDLVMDKALRMCTNCHKPLDDPHYSKCSGCRKAGNERAKRYQARKKESKAAATGVNLQTIAEERHDGTQPKIPSEMLEPGTSSRAHGEGTATKTRSRPPTISATATVALQLTYGKSDAGTRDSMYMNLIDRLQLDRQHPGGQRMLGHSKGHDVNLEVLDRLTEIRLSTTAQSPPHPQPPPSHAAPGPPVGTDSQDIEQHPPQREQRHCHHTPPRKQLSYSVDYFTVDPHHVHTPQASRNPSSSMPTPAQSPPLHPPGHHHHQSSPDSMHPGALEAQEYQLHPLLANIPPDQWAALSSSAAPLPLVAESPSQVLLPAASPLVYPAPPFSGYWDAATQCRRYYYDHEQQTSDHANTVDHGKSNNNDNDNVSSNWVNGPSLTERLDAANVVDPELMKNQGVDDAETGEVDLGCWLNLSEFMEKGSHEGSEFGGEGGQK